MTRMLLTTRATMMKMMGAFEDEDSHYSHEPELLCERHCFQPAASHLSC